MIAETVVVTCLAVGAMIGAVVKHGLYLEPPSRVAAYPILVRPFGARSTRCDIYTPHMMAQQLWRIAAHASHYFGMDREEIHALYRDLRIKWWRPNAGLLAIDPSTVGFVGTKRPLRGWTYGNTVCVVMHGGGLGIEETAFTHEVLHWLLARIRRNPDTAHADSEVWERLEWIIRTDETIMIEETKWKSPKT